MTIFECIPKILEGCKRPVIMEIGAARCEDTIRIIESIAAPSANTSFEAVEYYAVEPDPRNIEEIKGSRARYFTHLIPAAIGNANKRVIFHQSSGRHPRSGHEHTLSGSLKRPLDHIAVHPWCKFEHEVVVRMMRLDDVVVLYSIPHIDFIWCDVQGAEDLVIEGGQDALAHTRFFYTEYYENQMYEGQIGHAEIHRRLPGGTHGWRIVERWDTNIIFENTSFTPRLSTVASTPTKENGTASDPLRHSLHAPPTICA